MIFIPFLINLIKLFIILLSLNKKATKASNYLNVKLVNYRFYTNKSYRLSRLGFFHLLFMKVHNK